MYRYTEGLPLTNGEVLAVCDGDHAAEFRLVAGVLCYFRFHTGYPFRWLSDGRVPLAALAGRVFSPYQCDLVDSGFGYDSEGRDFDVEVGEELLSVYDVARGPDGQAALWSQLERLFEAHVRDRSRLTAEECSASFRRG